jgi:hypothetical protein
VCRAGLYSEWYDEWICANEHYLQISLDFSNLESSVQWALTHDNLAKQLGQQARQFARTRLRNEDMECYTYRLLLEYAAIVY